jgi:allantoinase
MKEGFDLILRGGIAVLPRGPRRTDLAVKNGRVAQIGNLGKTEAAREIDARGLVVFPGFIDAHVHLNEPGRGDWEGLDTGTRALAAGGVTTFFDMPLNSTPPVVTAKELEKKRKLALGKSRVDFGLWGGLVRDNVQELKGMARAGAIGFKAFMCGSGMEDFPAADSRTLEAGAREGAKLGKILAVHAEDAGETARLTEQFCSRGETSWRDYLKSRPVEAEAKAVRDVLEIAARTGCRLHVVHVSCPEVLALIAKARKAGLPVTAETCPHYLFFDETALGRIGGLAKCSPPLRNRAAVRGLWKDLARGRLDTVGSDHSPSPASLKTGRDFFKIWGGISGCQHAMPLWIGGARRRGIGWGRISALASGNAAALFGLSGKGIIRPGADADFSILRMGGGEPIVARKLLYKHRHSLYTGTTPQAAVLFTVVRGTVVYEAGVSGKKAGSDFRGQEVRLNKGNER